MTGPQNVQAPEDPLEMANNVLAGFRAMAARAAKDPVAAAAEQLNEQGTGQARLAASLALVSIARDLRRIADHLTGADS